MIVMTLEFHHLILASPKWMIRRLWMLPMVMYITLSPLSASHCKSIYRYVKNAQLAAVLVKVAP